MAQVYLDWGRTDEALAALSDAGRLCTAEADRVRLERLWISAYTAAADWSAVAEHARRLLILVPGEPYARHALARANLEQRGCDEARAVYEAILRTDPADALAHERLGVLLLGSDPAAVQHLYAAGSDLAGRLLTALAEPGAAEDPAYASALAGRALFEVEEWALAACQFERALSYNPDYADAHAYLGHALDRLGEPEAAFAHLQRAITLSPDSAVAHIFLGLHYDRLGDWVAARAEYEVAYDLDTTNPATCVEIGETWAAEGNYVAAEIWLKEAVRIQPEDPALWAILARFYLDHSVATSGEAMSATEMLLTLVPDAAYAHDLRGWAALQAGDYDIAQDHLMEAIILDPMLAEAHYHLGLLWSILGQHRQAQEEFSRAGDLDVTGKLAPLIERATGKAP